MDPSLQIEETTHSSITINKSTQTLTKRFRRPSDRRTLIRWRNEVSALNRVGSHPNITHLLSSSETDPNPSITLTLAPGRPLSSYDPSMIKGYTPTIALQLSWALSYIHNLGMIHDDVKPSNIMLSIHPSPFSSPPPFPSSSNPTKTTVHTTLIDFGAAIFSLPLPQYETDIDTDTRTRTRTYAFNTSGTPWYMAPEYMRRTKGTATDVWGLGVTMAWALGEFGAWVPEEGRVVGEWILPRVWEEKGERGKMESWIGVVLGVGGRLRAEVVEEDMDSDKDSDRDRDGQAVVGRVVVGEMLEYDFERRVGLDEVVRRLGGT